MGLLSSIFGSKVKVPKLKEIDIDKELDKAFQSVRERLPEAQQTAQSLGEADADTALAVLERFAPGTRDLISQQVSNLQSGLRGELPADVQRAVTDNAAARAQAGGFGGSRAAGNLELRDLGLTSLNRIDTAMAQTGQTLANFRNLGARGPTASSMFLSPAQRIGFEQNERNAQFNRDAMAAQARAQPDPIVSGLANTVGTVAGGALGGSGLASGLGGQIRNLFTKNRISPGLDPGGELG